MCQLSLMGIQIHLMRINPFYTLGCLLCQQYRRPVDPSNASNGFGCTNARFVVFMPQKMERTTRAIRCKRAQFRANERNLKKCTSFKIFICKIIWSVGRLCIPERGRRAYNHKPWRDLVILCQILGIMDISGDQVLFCSHLHPLTGIPQCFLASSFLTGNDLPSSFSKNIAGRCQHGHAVWHGIPKEGSWSFDFSSLFAFLYILKSICHSYCASCVHACARANYSLGSQGAGGSFAEEVEQCG